MLKAAIPVFFCLASGLSHAGWVQLGTFNDPNLASSVVEECQHRIVNTASRKVFIYPTIFTPTQTATYDFQTTANPTVMQRMLLTPTGVDATPMRNTLKDAYDYLHEGVSLEENKIRESYFSARIMPAGTNGENRNKLFIATSFFVYNTPNFTAVGSAFQVNAMYYPYFALQQLC